MSEYKKMLVGDLDDVNDRELARMRPKSAMRTIRMWMGYIDVLMRMASDQF